MIAQVCQQSSSLRTGASRLLSNKLGRSSRVISSPSSRRIRMANRRSLTIQVKALAATRLSALEALSFEGLTRSGTEEVHLVGGWGFRGTVWTDLQSLDADTLRVAVIHQVSAWWWPGYFHGIMGFRITRAGARSELTREDGYDLD